MIARIRLKHIGIHCQERNKRQLLRIETGKRVIRFKEKIRKKSNNILKEYLREIEKNRENKNR